YCDGVKNLKISQAKTGKVVERKPEWKVSILNDCMCSRFNIQLSCGNFQTIEKIDPWVLDRISDSQCAVNKGTSIQGHSTFNFTYAWDTAYPFRLLDAQFACS
ncbi:unnamed protein product, partial [Linum tenue]